MRESKRPKSQIEIENEKKSMQLLQRAQFLLDEQKDDVKAMNKMVLYSKVVTIRDKQLVDNKRMQQEWLED